MKTLRNYEVAGQLLLAGTGVPAAVGDQLKMFLDTDANVGFPEFVLGVIQHPIVKTKCGSYTSYTIQYDEADLEGSVSFLRNDDVVDVVLTVQADVIAAALDGEVARALAAEALLAPKASPTFTGTVTLPSTTSIGAVSSIELGYLGGVTSAIQTQLNTKAPLASPTFTGTVMLGDTVNVVLNSTTGTKFGTSTTQKLAFHNATPVVQRAGSAQAAVVTTPSTLTAYGYTQAQADSIVTLLNEIRAALVEKGIIKGAA